MFENDSTRTCLADISPANGNVAVAPCVAGDASQEWVTAANANGSVLRNLDANLCLGQDGTRPVLVACDANATVWRIMPKTLVKNGVGTAAWEVDPPNIITEVHVTLTIPPNAQNAGDAVQISSVTVQTMIEGLSRDPNGIELQVSDYWGANSSVFPANVQQWWLRTQLYYPVPSGSTVPSCLCTLQNQPNQAGDLIDVSFVPNGNNFVTTFTNRRTQNAVTVPSDRLNEQLQEVVMNGPMYPTALNPNSIYTDFSFTTALPDEDLCLPSMWTPDLGPQTAVLSADKRTCTITRVIMN